MSLSEQLWAANQDLVQVSLNHPFVQGIGDGSLPPAIFAYYVGQDAFFLEAFARAYSIAAAKAPDWQGFQVFHELATGVLQELTLHQNYAQTWNVDLTTIQPGTATRQYTDFLLATAWSQPVGVTAVAMSPCMRLYSYLGEQLALDGIPQHRYTDWITTYSGDEFAPLVQQLEALVEQYAADTEITRSTYRHAMICERDFFEAAWVLKQQA
ncbi:MAG: TenA family protein [Cyanothece sp. SIO2G6]|nr:TenA family protein [Cyanothece sp. SIO2G6]